VLRALAKAANNPDVYRSTYTPEALRTPQVAASVAERYLADNRLGEARSVLEAAIQPGLIKRGKSGTQGPDYDWETAWIGYLEKAGRLTEAQEARWSSFERTASIERAKAYVSRLPDFEDVEAETRVFATVRGYPDPERALALLIEWPALGEASRFIDRRGAELSLNPEQAEGWARRLGRRYPQAAEQLLRGAAAGAFRRREYGTSSRLTEAANALSATSL
jgi:hypothetical protein